MKTSLQPHLAIEPFTRVYSAEKGDALDELSNSIVDLVEDGKLDKAEEVSRQLLDRYPDQVDGLFSLGMVYEARGQNEKAAEYYRKAVDFMRSMPEFEEEAIDWVLEKAFRMESASFSKT